MKQVLNFISGIQNVPALDGKELVNKTDQTSSVTEGVC